jgi:hypothetical protein
MKNRMSHQKLGWSALMLGVLSLSSASSVAAEEKQAKPAESKKTTPARAAGGGIEQEKTVPNIESGKWTGPRLADGQPDVSGHWSNTIANHNNFTDPQGGIPNDTGTPNQQQRPLGPRGERAPSRVSDPADGQVPFQPWAIEKVKEFRSGFTNPTKGELVEPLARCAPAGIPKSLYWHGYEIAQFPGYVVFYFNSGTRIIHLDGKPHLPENIKLWNGDSRGHWEGNTLVVDVTNQNGKALFGRTGEFISENGHIQEKYIFQKGGTRFNYVAVLTDPTVYTRPFTVTVPARKWTAKDKTNGWHFEVEPSNYPANYTGKRGGLDNFERICTENNNGFGLGAAEKPQQ